MWILIVVHLQQFEKYYSKQRRIGGHVYKQRLCRPSKRHSIEACLSSSGVCFKKPRDVDDWELESNASRPQTQRIEEVTVNFIMSRNGFWEMSGLDRDTK